jgi:hypothetical protein
LGTSISLQDRISLQIPTDWTVLFCLWQLAHASHGLQHLDAWLLDFAAHFAEVNPVAFGSKRFETLDER